MELIRTSLLTGTSTAIKLAAAFIVNKVVAVVAGPPGLALIGQVQNISSVLQGLSSSLFNTAAVKYSAEWKEQSVRLHDFLGLSYTLLLWVTLGVGSACLSLSHWLADVFLGDGALWWVFALLGLAVPVFALNNLVLSVLNGLGQVGKLTAYNIGQSLLGLTVAAGLPLAFGLRGALAATVLASSVVMILLLPELRRHPWLKRRRVSWTRDRDTMRRLSSYAVMAVATAVCAPCAQLFARDWILSRCSLAEAGYWQGLMRFSGAYLAFFTATLGVYYLPRFSALAAEGVVRELKRGYALLLPSVALLFSAMWLMRSWLVPLLFSREFRPMEGLLAYQLIGDFLKIGSWVMSYVMLAKGRTLLFVVSEVLFNVIYAVCVVLFVGNDGSGGAAGAVKAWILLYALYWLFLGSVLRVVLRESGKS